MRTSPGATRCSAARCRWRAVASWSRRRRAHGASRPRSTDHGQARVEAVLDAALALEAHIDVNRALYRTMREASETDDVLPERSGRAFYGRWQTLPGETSAKRDETGGSADAAAAGVRPAVVPRAARPRARAVGARRVPRGARGVVLLLSGVRVPDHERGLGLVLACAAAARSRVPAPGHVRAGDQGAFGRRAPARGRQDAGALGEPVPPRLLDVGADRETARPRRGARRSAPRRTTSGSFATISIPSLPPTSTCSSTRPVRTARSRSRRATSMRFARRSSRRSSTSARRAWPRPTSRTMAASRSCTTTPATDAGSTCRAPSACSTTWSGSGDGRSRCTPSTSAGTSGS